MESDRIKILLDKYYSGEISPNEYKILLSALKKYGGMTPELEADCKMFLAIESCEPIMPDGLEKRLEKAIDRKQNNISRIVKIFISGSAAAIVFLCITIGLIHYGNKELSESEFIAKVSVANTEKTVESEEMADTIEHNPTENEEYIVPEISDGDLEKATQIVDTALLNVLSAIHISQNNVAECIESVKIKQETNFNIF